MSSAIVTTTINIPQLLDDYCRDARQYGHEDVVLYVIGDQKTPAVAGEFCAGLQKRYGYTVHYLGIKDQLVYLANYPRLRDHLPFNSIQRRNIGLFAAYASGADVIITIDDDNFLVEEDFVGQHSVVGTEQEIPSVSSSTGWYNVCDLLEERQNLPFYHRGYPMGQRWRPGEITRQERRGRLVVNAGLWLEAPDIDALTWLDLPIEATAYKGTYPQGVTLAAGTWSPFNSQNTALAREVIPAYFLSPNIGRYDDIWASYIVRKIADHRGDMVRFGHPLVRQKRNPHNYFKDFDNERLGMELTDTFVAALRSIELQGHDYQTCFAEIATALEERQGDIVGSDERFGDQYQRMIEGMQIWHESFVLVQMPA